MYFQLKVLLLLLFITYDNLSLVECVVSSSQYQSKQIDEPKYRTAYACEWNRLEISCDEGKVINIIQANYGRFNISICNDHRNLDWSVDCSSAKSFDVTSNSCGFKTNCTMLAANSVFNDPCYGTIKYLEVHYQCVPDISNSLNFCGDWNQYKDIKCFKVLEEKTTEDEANDKCQELELGSTLITISDQDEQQFLNNLLKNYSDFSMNAWIGMKYNGVEYDWSDGTDTNFTNWSEYAVRDGEAPCVHMSLVNGAGMLGQWFDTWCIRRALVVCQKRQELSLNKLRNIVENITNTFKAEIKGLIASQNDLQHNLRTELADLKIQLKKLKDTVRTP